MAGDGWRHGREAIAVLRVLQQWPAVRCDHPSVRRAALFDALEYDSSDPKGYRAAASHLTKLLGGRELAVKAFEVPPGESLCPYHYEYVEEWLIVLEGSVIQATVSGAGQRLSLAINLTSQTSTAVTGTLTAQLAAG